MITVRLQATLVASAIALLALVPASAAASWNGAGSDAAYAEADSLGSLDQPTRSIANRDVTITWTAPGSGAPATGYLVRRYDESGNGQTIGPGCSGTIATTSCIEAAVPPGTWRYRVTSVNANWRSPESAQSAAVVIAAPALSLTQSSVASLPTQVSGQITNFASGQNVSFTLDSPTGQTLSGSIAPTPVPASGTADVSVTLPAGMAPGSHTIYARGNAGDSATAQISVLVPQTLTTSAWDLRDASAGGPEVNVSDPIAFASDGRTVATSNPPSSFQHQPLPADRCQRTPADERLADLGGVQHALRGRRRREHRMLLLRSSTGVDQRRARHPRELGQPGRLRHRDRADELLDRAPRRYLDRDRQRPTCPGLRPRLRRGRPSHRSGRALGRQRHWNLRPECRGLHGPAQRQCDQPHVAARSKRRHDVQQCLELAHGLLIEPLSAADVPDLRAERRDRVRRVLPPPVPALRRRLRMLVPRGPPGHDGDRHPRQRRLADLLHVGQLLQDRHRVAAGDQQPGASERGRVEGLRAQHDRAKQRARPGGS